MEDDLYHKNLFLLQDYQSQIYMQSNQFNSERSIYMKPGVFLAKKKDGTLYYRSSLTYKNKHISLGSYDTEDQAHQTYMEASMILSSSLTSSHITLKSLRYDITSSFLLFLSVFLAIFRHYYNYIL